MLRALLLIVALGSGGISAWLLAATPTSEASPAVQPEVASAPMEEVLLAAVDMPKGHAVTVEAVRWQPWPADALNDAFIVRSRRPDAVEELVGSKLKDDVLAGRPIIAQDLVPKGASFLSAVLVPGMRAVAIAISAEKTAGGFVLPDDRVDVLLTSPCRPEEGCNGAMSARTILKNVRVLAIDQSGSEDGSSGVLLGKTATLELDPHQAEELIAAEASGTLSLVLRSAADSVETQEVSSDTNRTVRVWRKAVGHYVPVH